MHLHLPQRHGAASVARRRVQVGARIDVAQHGRIGDVDERGRRGREQRAGARVAVERRERVVMAAREADRMAALSAIDGRDGRREPGVERACDRFDRRRCDPWHVGERDDPAGAVGAGAHAGREARAHAALGVGREHDLTADVVEQVCKPFRAGAHDRDHVGEHGGEPLRGRDGDGRAVGQLREQLALHAAGIEARAEACGQQHAGGERRMSHGDNRWRRCCDCAVRRGPRASSGKPFLRARRRGRPVCDIAGGGRAARGARDRLRGAAECLVTLCVRGGEAGTLEDAAGGRGVEAGRQPRVPRRGLRRREDTVSRADHRP